MTSFGEFELAHQLRDVIYSYAQEVVNTERPLPRYGVTQSSYNIFTGFITVLLDGDTQPIDLPCSPVMRPWTVGQKVIVTGKGNGMVVSGTVTGSIQERRPYIVGRRDVGGAFENQIYRQTTFASTAFPVEGQAAWAGRWNGGTSFYTLGASLEITVSSTFLQSVFRTYRVSISYSMSAGAWTKLFPVESSGTFNGYDVGLEILVDTTGFELRVRGIKTGTGFGIGGYNLTVDITSPGTEWTQSQTRTVGADTDAPPANALGAPKNAFGARDNLGPLLAPAYSFPELSQTLLHGGGAVTYNLDGVNSYLLWSDRFTIFGTGNNEFSPTNGFAVPSPAAGVAVPVYQSSTVTSRNTVAGGIQLLQGEALYYELPIGKTGTPNVMDPGSAANLRIVAATDATVLNMVVPSHWVLIGRVSPDVTHGAVIMGTSEIIDAPRLLTLSASWTNQGGANALARVRKVNGQLVIMSGIITPVSTFAINATSGQVCQVPVGLRPAATERFVTVKNTTSGTGTVARINVDNAGIVTITNDGTAMATTSTLTLACSWIAEG